MARKIEVPSEYWDFFASVHEAMDNLEKVVRQDAEAGVKLDTTATLDVVHFTSAPAFALRAHLEGKINVYDFPELYKLVRSASIVWEFEMPGPNGVVVDPDAKVYPATVDPRFQLTWRQLDETCRMIFTVYTADDILRYTDPEEYASRTKKE